MANDAFAAGDCWQLWYRLRQDMRIRFDRSEPAGLDGEFERFTRNRSFSPKLWNDAYLAAYASAGGLRLVTFDRGFQDFRGLELETLA